MSRSVDAAQQRLLRIAARALARHGLVQAYGHCSLRLDREYFLVSASKPLGLVRPDESGIVLRVDADLPDGVLPEVRIHREIYRMRPDVGGIVRVQPPMLMSLSVLGRTPQPCHGFGSYFHPAVPLWDDPLLLRDDARAAQLARQLGSGRAIVMRGNGAVLVADALPMAVVLAWYLEDAARVERDALACGLEPIRFSAEQAASRAIWSGRLLERMWDYLSHGDPEVEPWSDLNLAENIR